MTPPDDRGGAGPGGLNRPAPTARRFRFVTVDVFTDARFGGNPLAVFPEAEGLSDAEMSALAREFNLSETTFVLPPADPANTARVRIFARGGHEMPFAGHPNVGTGFVLAARARDGALRFEEIAGLVAVRLEGGVTTIEAPQPLATGPGMDAALLAGCVGLEARDVVLDTHGPLLASCGNSFVLAEVTPDALARATPDLARFRDAAARYTAAGPNRLPLYLWARTGAAALRARMFSPLSGTVEDAATGSAATPLAALLHSLGAGSSHLITQGVEMGRPSALHVRAWAAPDGVRASVGGSCVPVLEGWATL